jgi:hypothetical protein
MSRLSGQYQYAGLAKKQAVRMVAVCPIRQSRTSEHRGYDESAITSWLGGYFTSPSLTRSQWFMGGGWTTPAI